MARKEPEPKIIPPPMCGLLYFSTSLPIKTKGYQKNYYHFSNQKLKHFLATKKNSKGLLCSSMATSISATGFKTGGSLVYSSLHGSWGTCLNGENHHLLVKSIPTSSVRVIVKPIRLKPMMKNVNEGKGLFAPLVVVTRNVVGKKTFNQLRGKAIALHSQVINEFCKSIGADAKQRQGLIRLAKKNGERLGFLA